VRITEQIVDANGIIYEPDMVRRGPPPEQEILLAIDQLGKLKRTKTGRWGSYGLKHYVENRAGRYISNGAVIVAALRTGITVQWRRESPNCLIGVSKRGAWRTT
jgi:hypothetical protein